MPEARDALRKLRHDMSNPLAALLAETQLLLLSETKYDTETVSSLRQIEELARRMRKLLTDLDV
jgi:signal transduction histidine kinase